MSINEVHGNELALFQTPTAETGTQRREWVSYRPVNQITEGSALEFNIPSTSTTYIDLKHSELYIKARVTKHDGTQIGDKTADPVALVNAPLHTMFSQVDLSVQQHPISEVGPHYPFKAYLDTLLDTENKEELQAQGFQEDESGHMDATPDKLKNNGLILRHPLTEGGKMIDLVGDLKLDLCKQERLLINGLPLNLKFWQTNDAFRLMAKAGADHYKLRIEDAVLRVATVKINPGVLLGHAEALKKASAVYPFTKSVVKTYAVAGGQYSFTQDDLFQGEVPSRVIIGLVSSNAVHGSYEKNPYNFQNYDCNFVGFYVNGQSVPSHPLQPNYGADNFIEAYQQLIGRRGNRNTAVTIDRNDYKDGYCLYVIEPFGSYTEDEYRLPEKGHTRLELRFGTALPETCTVIVYAKFPALMKVDESRNVTIQ